LQLRPSLPFPTLSPLFAFLRDVWRFLRTRKRYWLAPILLLLVIFGVLFVLAEGSAITPFLYPLF